MKVIGEAKSGVFPMKVRCKHKVDKDGLSYGNKPDSADVCWRSKKMM